MQLISAWSGGKDSCYALMLALAEQSHKLAVLHTMMNENGRISRSHALPLWLLQQHASALQVAHCATPATWGDYESVYIDTLKNLKQRHATDAVVFGDIDIQSHRDWEEKVCTASEHEALLPLWQRARKDLVYDMIDSGIHAIITSCNTYLGEDFLGRVISRELVADLEEKGVDVCGENGEYHTLVLDCPLFTEAISLPPYEKCTHEHYCFLTWE